ncbi:hypothetical protein [Rhizobium mayense]|uniref:Uncharacterized protein n=1 Tax=Rhizobium mayense TaxID=1312184 RepID=A0ABT7JXT6_9HYPH|nr:hypothetical protein [Rhizobium mayense]MDL2399739.1 hypothetical protein [Rhizobium mayense]
MNSAAIFFFFVLPFVIAALGWIAVLVNDWNDRRQKRLHPGE